MKRLLLSSAALLALAPFAMAAPNTTLPVQEHPTALSAAASRLSDAQLDKVTGGDLGLSLLVTSKLLNAAGNSGGNSLNNLHSVQSEGNGVLGATLPIIGVISQNPGTGP